MSGAEGNYVPEESGAEGGAEGESGAEGGTYRERAAWRAAQRDSERAARRAARTGRKRRESGADRGSGGRAARREGAARRERAARRRGGRRVPGESGVEGGAEGESGAEGGTYRERAEGERRGEMERRRERERRGGRERVLFFPLRETRRTLCQFWNIKEFLSAERNDIGLTSRIIVVISFSGRTENGPRCRYRLKFISAIRIHPLQEKHFLLLYCVARQDPILRLDTFHYRPCNK